MNLLARYRQWKEDRAINRLVEKLEASGWSFELQVAAFAWASGEGCDLAPEGWWCSRESGHEGPCAARPL